MPVSLSELAGALASGQVMLRGRSRAFRLVSASEQLRIQAALEEPTPPPMPVPMDKVTGAPIAGAKVEPNYNDLGYQARYSAWSAAVKAVEVAMALDLATGPDGTGAGGAYSASMNDADFKRWAKAVSTQMVAPIAEGGAGFTSQELSMVWRALRVHEGTLEENAGKN